MKKIILVATLLVLMSNQSFSQAGTITLGIALKQLSNELNQAIENAKNAGLSLEIEAGRQVSLSLENFKNVYNSSLNTTFDKLDKLTTKQWESLKSLTNQIQKQTVTSIDDITKKAQQITDALPFHSHQPHLRSFTPTYIVPSSHNYDVVITCHGNFVDMASKGYEPTLKIGNFITSSAGGNQDAEFHVPIAEFMKLKGIENYKFGYVKCQINFPWRDKYLHVFPSKKIDTYDLYIGTLPTQPGKIILTQRISTPNVKRQTHVTNPPHRQSSCADGGNQDKTIPWEETPESGWDVVRGTSHFNVLPGAQGNYGIFFNSDDGNKVIYTVKTNHPWGPFSGDASCLNFTISFDETKDDPVISYSDSPYNLNWGDSKTIDIPAGEWKIKFTAFDGSINEFAGVDNSNPFIQIIETGGIYKLVTANPSTLSWH